MSKVRVWSAVPLPDVGRGQIAELERTPRVEGLIRNGRLVELAPEPSGWYQRTVDELRDELRGRGLPVSGTKQELVDRLTQAEQPVQVDQPPDDGDALESDVEVDGGG